MLKLTCAFLARFSKNEEGASAVEYAILVGCVGAALAAIVGHYTSGLDTLFTGITTGITTTH